MTPLSERVRLLRQKRGWTQEQLGQKAGLPAPNLARLESGGRPPSLEKLEKIAQALGVPLYVLFLEDEKSLLGAHEMPRANTVSLQSHRDARFARRLLELATRLSPERRADLLAVIQTMLTDRAAVEEKGPTLKNRADQLAQKWSQKAEATVGSELRRTVQLRALSKPTPRRILGLLKGKDLSPCVSSQLSETELCVCDLANEIGCNPSTITRHLRVLREAGLVHASRRGPFVNSRRDQGAFEDLLKYLNTLR